jgi:ubiquinone/menaquinone biosynthesis C-methylase UbiE
MTTPQHSSAEQAGTYMVQNRSNQGEMKRLVVQDRMLTTGMGGVLPEQNDLSSIQSVLDVGCGTGGWLLGVAQTFPAMTRLVGVDISSKMITYARERAAAEQFKERVTFQVMDAQHGLTFSDATFDLVNLRLGDSWLRTWDWPALLGEFLRVTRPGGIIRVTESDMVDDNGQSPALRRFMDLFFEALCQSGHYFSRDRRCLLDTLADMFRRHGIQNVQTRAHRLEFVAGTEAGQSLLDDVKYSHQNFLPFLRKWTQVPDDYEALGQQALRDMQRPGFSATWNFLTVWGTRPTSCESFGPVVK